jgi:hypothetical protein
VLGGIGGKGLALEPEVPFLGLSAVGSDKAVAGHGDVELPRGVAGPFGSFPIELGAPNPVLCRPAEDPERKWEPEHTGPHARSGVTPGAEPDLQATLDPGHHDGILQRWPGGATPGDPLVRVYGQQ